MKKLLAFALVFCLMLVPMSALAGEIYRYDEPVTLTAYARYETSYVDDAAALWLYEWARDKMNINFEVEGVTAESYNDFNTLMFATDDLPDVLLNWSISRQASTALYGDEEGMLMPYNDLITEETTPNLYAVFQEFADEAKIKLATLSGNIYILPQPLQQSERRTNLAFMPVWVRTDWFKAVGYEELPKSMDELLDALRKIKEQDPGQVGKDLVPLGGGNQFPWFFLQALGFVTAWTPQLIAPAGGGYQDHDVVVYPYHDNYFEYLKYMNTLYSEGLIDRDFYTLDTTQSFAKLSAGYCAAASAWGIHEHVENWQDWEMLPPLTSSVQDTPLVPYGGDIDRGNYMFLSSHCSNPEAAMRFIDNAYDPDIKYLFFWGPQAGVDDTYGLTEGWEFEADGVTRKLLDVVNGTRENQTEYVHNIGPFGGSGNVFDRRTDGSEVALYDPNTGAGYCALQTIERYCPYYVPRYPGALFTAEEQTRITDLETVLQDYIDSETAKFVTGVRPVTEEEFAKYRADLDALGMQEFIEMQTKAFQEQYR